MELARGAGSGPLREKYIADTQELISQLDPRRQARTIQNLQGAVLALQGRGGDTQIAHVTPEEVVIPKRLQTPELMAMLARVARQAGMNPRSLRVGSGRRNPKTGHEEFFGEADGPSPQQEQIFVSAHRDPRNLTLDSGSYYVGEGGIPYRSGPQTYQDINDFLANTYTGIVKGATPRIADKLPLPGASTQELRDLAFGLVPEYKPATEAGRLWQAGISGTVRGGAVSKHPVGAALGAAIGVGDQYLEDHPDDMGRIREWWKANASPYLR